MKAVPLALLALALAPIASAGPTVLDPETPVLHCQRGRLCTLTLPATEEVLSTASSDTVAWSLEVLKNTILLKAAPTATSADLFLSTTAGSYNIELQASTEPGPRNYSLGTDAPTRHPLAATTWATPTPALCTPSAFNPADLNFGYRWSRRGPFAPLRIYTAQGKTYVTLRVPPGEELPALFAVGAGDDLLPVNYLTQDLPDGVVLIADRVLDSAILRVGKKNVPFRREGKR